MRPIPSCPETHPCPKALSQQSYGSATNDPWVHPPAKWSTHDTPGDALRATLERFHDEITTSKGRVFQQEKRALLPARRSLLGQEQFTLGQISCLHLAGGRNPGQNRDTFTPRKEERVDMGNAG